VPFATPLIGMLMLGNLMKESGAVERLTKASSNEIANTGDAVSRAGHRLDDGGRRVPQDPARCSSWCSGMLAFILDGVAGVLFAKLLNWISGGKVNPMIGAAGISAFPMAARVVHACGGARGGLRELPADARHGRQCGRGRWPAWSRAGVLLALMGADRGCYL
jgi:Na+-transporting methylmalonyl-CoA/oxaloacetate decarboxylase beta subunit